jgi:hypothetical protein
MFRDLRIKKRSPMRVEARQCALFVDAHKPAITYYIPCEDGG